MRVYFRLLPCLITILALTISIPKTAISSPLGDADRYLFRSIHEDMESEFLDTVMSPIQSMGDPRFYLGVCMLLCAFGNEKMHETGKLAATAFMGTGAVGYTLKRVVRSPRPGDTEKLDRTSFPSGHTITAFTLAAVVSYQYRKLAIPAYSAAFGVAFARIYFGRHYPSDVLGGATIGILGAMLTMRYKSTVLSISF